uniref:Uncharacterized protein n=1 Tax=Populus alba TaxID=43335 RepID=A0A4U5N745_POPAL|nr:hypothetical protein D5086_0000281930 [Populus alba]
MIASLIQLKVLEISTCEELEQIIALDNDDEKHQILLGTDLQSACFPNLYQLEGDHASPINVEKEMVLLDLQWLILEKLPRIVYFSHGCCGFIFPCLSILALASIFTTSDTHIFPRRRLSSIPNRQPVPLLPSATHPIENLPSTPHRETKSWPPFILAENQRIFPSLFTLSSTSAPPTPSAPSTNQPPPTEEPSGGLQQQHPQTPSPSSSTSSPLHRPASGAPSTATARSTKRSENHQRLDHSGDTHDSAAI